MAPTAECHPGGIETQINDGRHAVEMPERWLGAAFAINESVGELRFSGQPHVAATKGILGFGEINVFVTGDHGHDEVVVGHQNDRFGNVLAGYVLDLGDT